MSASFRDAVAMLPEQIEDAAHRFSDQLSAVFFPPFDQVVFVGMGGSAMAADLVVASASELTRKPLQVVRDYELPAFVSHRTLVVGVSYSGSTEETLAALEVARLKEATIALIGTSGPMSKAFGADAVVEMVLPDGMMPRAAVGALTAACALLLERVNVFPAAFHSLIRASAQLDERRSALERGSAETRALEDLVDRFVPVICGGGTVGRVAAARWKADLNENAKMAAWASAVPENNHNEVCMWQDADRQFGAVHLRHELEHERVSARFAALQDLLGELDVPMIEVRARGADALGQVLDLVYIGGWLSLRVADARGVDPESIVFIDRLKAALAERPREREVLVEARS